MQIAIKFTNVHGLIDAADAVLAKATMEEKQCMHQLNGVPCKGVLPIDILLWAVEEVASDDPGQRDRCAAHRSVVQGPTAAAVPVPPIIILDNNNEV